MTVDEVYLEIGQNIYNIIEDDEFLSATLKIERLHKYVGYNGFYFNGKNERKYLDVAFRCTKFRNKFRIHT